MEQLPPSFTHRTWASVKRYWGRFWESALWGALQRIETIAFIVLLAVIIWRVVSG